MRLISPTQTANRKVDRKRLEEELRLSEERFFKLFSSSPAIQALTRMVDQRIMAVNESFLRISGYSREEIVGHTAMELNLWPIPSQRGEMIQALKEHGQLRNMEIEIRKKAGDIMTLLLSAEVMEIGGEPCLLAAALDITERKQADERNRRQLGRLAALRNIDLAITASLDMRVTMEILLEQVTTHLNVDAADVLLLNPYTQMLEYAAGRGFYAGGRKPHRAEIRLGDGHAGRAALERRTISISNTGEVEDFLRIPLITGELFSAYHVAPLITKGHVKGVLEVFHRTPLDPDDEWMDFLEALAGQAAIAIDNASLFDDLQRSNLSLSLAYDTTLEGWSRALDMRDKETEGHTQRVTEMTVRLARAIGMSEAELVHVRRGALLHDIGKMGIPDSILLKPGPLSDEEWVIMRRHPEYAYHLLSPIAFLRAALDIPYYHHEKWDGTGYPGGLRGEQIPLAARIFAVVDVWDALCSDRPYRAAWPEDKVRAHIRALSGQHFDPKVVEAFMGMEV